jgi:serine protease AprX
MKTNHLLILSLLVHVLTSSAASARIYFIGFTDRNGSPYSLSLPTQFLSQRAIDRRTRNNIPYTDNDLPVNPSYVNSLSAQGAIVLNTVKWFNGVTVWCDSALIPVLEALPFVRQATPVKRQPLGSGRVNKKDVYGAPLKPLSMMNTLHTVFNYGPAYRQINQLHGDFLHAAGYCGEGMVIAAIDAGFNSANQLHAFDSLYTSGRLVSTWDFVDLQQGVYEDDVHGTEVLSTMAANIPGTLVGTAPRAAYILLRSEDANTEYLVEEYNWAAAAAYADSAGTDIITSSLGYTQFDDPSMNHTYLDMNGNTCPASLAADVAASKGMLVLVSAGNLGNGFWHYISSPADADSVLAVGAVDSSGYKAAFSSWGPSADGDIKPNVAAMGLRSYLAFYDGTFGTGSGTSFSCPILAGAAACLWQAHPDKSNMEIFHAIQQSASYFANPGDSLGYGIPNFQTANMLLGGTVMDIPTADELSDLYPNPVTDRINVGFKSTTFQYVQVELYDLKGSFLLHTNLHVDAGVTNELSIELPSGAVSGVYVLKVASKERTFFRKVVCR